MQLRFRFTEKWADSMIIISKDDADGFRDSRELGLNDLPDDMRSIVMAQIKAITSINAPWRATQGYVYHYAETVIVSDAEFSEEGELIKEAEYEVKERLEIGLEAVADRGGIQTYSAQDTGLILTDNESISFWRWCEQLDFSTIETNNEQENNIG